MVYENVFESKYVIFIYEYKIHSLEKEFFLFDYQVKVQSENTKILRTLTTPN